jgi:isoleucyl-tRNA synthetase
MIDDNKSFPADFIAEGVDQTRGWFYTLHAIATMTKGSVAYKNVVSNGLVLDKAGQKMSKRLGNAVDPFKTLEKYGPDATRWYMISNAQPWDNLKFDLTGIEEVTRKFFGTLFNTYSFFALYANLDHFQYKEENLSKETKEIDLWILSRLNTLTKSVEASYNDYEPTRAARLIQSFVIDELSNWYVRLCRKRFWKGEMNEDKKAAYETLFVCLQKVSILMSPIAPFYSDLLYSDLSAKKDSVHLADFPLFRQELINEGLEFKMGLAQKISSLILRLRKKTRIKVRQPLLRVLIPSIDTAFESAINDVKAVILSEVNIKSIEFISQNDSLLKKKAKANFKVLGPKYGQDMKAIASAVSSWTSEEVSLFEKEGKKEISLNSGAVFLTNEDVEIVTADVPGWEIATAGNITVALDITISKALQREGFARDFVNKIQNLRKERDLEVSDLIVIKVLCGQEEQEAIENNLNYICSETLTDRLDFVSKLGGNEIVEESESFKYLIEKVK